jgi:hypothetical protein
MPTDFDRKLYRARTRAARSQPIARAFLKGRTLDVLTACPACARTGFTVIADYDRYGAALRFAQCGDCGLVFLLDRPTASDYGLFYEHTYRALVGAWKGRPETTRAVHDDTTRRRHAPRPARLVGAGRHIARRGRGHRRHGDGDLRRLPLPRNRARPVR